MSIAEFHDIGKIVNWFALGLQTCRDDGKFEKEPHDFEKCVGPEWQVDFASPVWESIHRKDDACDLRLAHFPNSRDWFVVSLADGLAASMRRLPEKEVGGDAIYGRHCLWTGETALDPRLNRLEQLHEVIVHLNSNPAWEATERRYSRILQARTECARPGLNVATLHSHSILTGKLFRVLRPLAAGAAEFPSRWDPALKLVAPGRTVLVHLQVNFVQQPHRTSDLEIFAARRAAITDALARFGDNVLIQYANNIVALFLSDAAADALIDGFLQRGFTVSILKAKQVIVGDLNSIGLDDALSKLQPEVIHLPLPDVILPPLCENCQMAHGGHRWPAEYLAGRTDLSEAARGRFDAEAWNTPRIEDFSESDRVKLDEWLEERNEEHLCARCFDLRRNAPALSRLARWDTGKVAWAHISLDLAELQSALRRLHVTYLRAQAQRIELDLFKLPVRLPLLADFINDYERMLTRWRERLADSFGPENLEEIDDDLFCVKLAATSDALRLLTIHRDLLAAHFPKLLELDAAPLPLAISIGPVKHPFFAPWHFLRNARTAVCLQLVGSGAAAIPINRLDALLRVITQAGRHSFHRLRAIARTSKALAEIILDDRAPDAPLAQLRRILPLGMDFESLMTLANLVEI